MTASFGGGLDRLLGLRSLEGVDEVREECGERVLLIRLDGEAHAIFVGRDHAVRVVRTRDRRWPLLPDCSSLGYAERLEAVDRINLPKVCHFFRRPRASSPPETARSPRHSRGRSADVVCAVDEASNLVVLEVGVEQEEILPLSRVQGGVVAEIHSGTSVHWHAHAQISSRIRLAFRPERLIIGGTPDDWIVEDVRIGWRRQIPAGGIAGRAFAGSLDDLARGGRDIVGVDAVYPGADVSITVTYVGDRPDGETFIGALWGPGIATPALVARWTPEGRPEPWVSTSIADAGLVDLRVAAP